MADGDSTPPNPFGGLPFFNDMMRAMSQQGPLNWDLAQQFAQLGAVGDSADPEPDTSTRLAYNALADIADMHVREITMLSTGPRDSHSEILTTTRAGPTARCPTSVRSSPTSQLRSAHEATQARHPMTPWLPCWEICPT